MVGGPFEYDVGSERLVVIAFAIYYSDGQRRAVTNSYKVKGL